MATLQEQWELLIVRLLAILRSESPQHLVLLVIGDLHECDGERSIQLILEQGGANIFMPTSYEQTSSMPVSSQ